MFLLLLFLLPHSSHTSVCFAPSFPCLQTTVLAIPLSAYLTLRFTSLLYVKLTH